MHRLKLTHVADLISCAQLKKGRSNNNEGLQTCPILNEKIVKLFTTGAKLLHVNTPKKNGCFLLQPFLPGLGTLISISFILLIVSLGFDDFIIKAKKQHRSYPLSNK
jgi:hypothetical protein